MMKTPSLRKHIRGVAAVELGLLLIPLVILLFGITEYGRAIYTYNTMVKSVRNAARYLTSRNPGDTDAQDIARCMAAFGNQDCTTPALAPGLGTGMIDVCDSLTPCAGVTTSIATGSGTINLVVVRVSGYDYVPMVDYVMPGGITFNNIVITMRSQL
jgi:Flp pilus assembly protein TadG